MAVSTSKDDIAMKLNRSFIAFANFSLLTFSNVKYFYIHYSIVIFFACLFLFIGFVLSNNY